LERLTKWIEDLVLAIPRWLYSRVAGEAAAAAAVAAEKRDALIDLREAISAAIVIRRGGSALDKCWTDARDAGTRAAVLAIAYPDEEIAARGRAFRDAFDHVTRNWVRMTREDFDALDAATDCLLDRIRELLG
jgi:hypothetical protein